jgi:hypothetical protein
MVAESSDGSLNLVVAPRGILCGKSRNRVLDFLTDSRPPWPCFSLESNFFVTSSRCQRTIVSGVTMVVSLSNPHAQNSSWSYRGRWR